MAPAAKADSEIAVPPATSETINLHAKKNKEVRINLATWLDKETPLNGLQSTEVSPWHIVLRYDQFDEDGDNVHSGVYEEFWASPEKYKRIYKSDNFNQTDYASDRGLFRRGDQQWPDPAESQVRAEIIAPFSYAATLQGFLATSIERTFSGYTLQCVLIERNSVIVSDPTQYCFEPGSSILRYSRGFGWYQTVYNRIASFQGHHLAQDVEVTKAGKPYLKMSVETIELISHVNEADFAPPTDAAGPIAERVSGVHPVPIKTSYPVWSASLRGQQFSVKVDIVIGKNGRVMSAHAVSGPAEGQKACEKAVKKWIYSPYLVLDKPVEVEEQVGCTHQ